MTHSATQKPPVITSPSRGQRLHPDRVLAAALDIAGLEHAELIDGTRSYRQVMGRMCVVGALRHLCTLLSCPTIAALLGCCVSTVQDQCKRFDGMPEFIRRAWLDAVEANARSTS